MKDKAVDIVRVVALSAVVFITGNSNNVAVAATLGVAQTPLFLGSSVQPNVFFVNDDSGSMDWEFMSQGHWTQRSYDPDPIRDGSFLSNDDAEFNTGGLFKTDIATFNEYTYYYYYAESDSVYGSGCARSMEGCNGYSPSIFAIDWRSRAAGLTTVFYSADATYEPWSGPCDVGVDCADASFTAARGNPRAGEAGYNLIRDLSTDGDANGGAFVYEVWIDDAGFAAADGQPRRGDNVNYEGSADTDGIAKPNGLVDLWDTHFRFTVNAGNIDVDRVTYDPQPSSGASPGLNETVTNLGNLAATSCYNVLGDSANVTAIHNEGAAPIVAATGGPGCRTIAEVQANIANWYQYSRRRSFPVKGAISAVIDAQPNFRFGITLLNEPNKLFVEIPDISVTNTGPHNLDLKDRLYKHNQDSFGTPLRNALKDAGEYYKDNIGKPDPIAYSCQKNFTVLFTDGYWNGSDPGVGDADSDGKTETLADVAYKYYIDDLTTAHANNVLVDPVEDDLPTYNPPEGDRTHQHMVSFTVAFGVSGRMVDELPLGSPDGIPDVRSDGSVWATGEATKNGDGVEGWGDASNDPEKIDDLWHAAFNSGGTFAAASTPAEVTEKLIDAITNIAARISSAAAVALNSGTLNANSRVYQASFDSNDWSGSIRSVPIQDGPVDLLPLGAPDGIDDSPSECASHPTLGELCDEEWDAAAKLEVRTASSRNIFTLNSDTHTGVEFKTLSALGAAQQTSLKTDPDSGFVDPDAVGQLRLDYIRGDNANEGTAATEFRVRKVVSTGNSKLGDIIHSAPAYVANPTLFFPDNLESSSYNAFKAAKKNRKPVVYVGANDGMLHAFDASNAGSKGEEMFAYIPGKLVDKLPLLTSRTYNNNHTYFVDGSPVTFDAHDGGWKTLLSGTAGAGGQLVYGLDITDPETFGTSDVLWEFTDEPRVSGTDVFGDVDLGYVIGDVSYARMNDGTWVIVFGNGFNNTQADGNVSATGNAVIYVVNAMTGALLKKFDTQVGMAEDPTGANRPNGIGRVNPIDVNGDFKADYLYAGDLFGNVWKMDVTSASPAVWDSKYLSGGKPKPFFIAKDALGVEQPITTAVAVKRHPEKSDETLVLFGTGSYFQINDATTTQTQTFYSVWDDNTATQYSRASMLEQKILSLENVLGTDGINREFRVTSSADIDPANYKIDWLTHKGWFMDLGYGADVGERVNVEPVLRGNRIIFVTLTPDPDPCEDGGSSWIMELNSTDGSRLRSSPFDVNGDGLIDDLDVVDFSGDAETVISGVRSKEGIVAKPGILNTQGKKELKFFSGTSGNIETVTESIDENMRDRQSWRQLR